MQKPLVRIENWAVVRTMIPPSYQDLRPGTRLIGNATGHLGAAGGTLIYTSTVVSVNEGLIETRNTLYQLGEASNEYKAWERKNRESAPL